MKVGGCYIVKSAKTNKEKAILYLGQFVSFDEYRSHCVSVGASESDETIRNRWESYGVKGYTIHKILTDNRIIDLTEQGVGIGLNMFNEYYPFGTIEEVKC